MSAAQAQEAEHAAMAAERVAYLSGYLDAFGMAAQPRRHSPSPNLIFLQGSPEHVAYQTGRSDGHAEARMREQGRGDLSATCQTVTTDAPTDTPAAWTARPELAYADGHADGYAKGVADEKDRIVNGPFPTKPRTTSHETTTLHRVAYLTGRARALCHAEGLPIMALALGELPLPNRFDVQKSHEQGREDGRTEAARRAAGMPPLALSKPAEEEPPPPPPSRGEPPADPAVTSLGTDLRAYAIALDIANGPAGDRYTRRLLTTVADDLRRYADKADRTRP